MHDADIPCFCRDMVQWLVPRLLGVKLSGESVKERKAAARADGGAGIPREQLQGLMQDRTSSHLMEVRHMCRLSQPSLAGVGTHERHAAVVGALESAEIS